MSAKTKKSKEGSKNIKNKKSNRLASPPDYYYEPSLLTAERMLTSEPVVWRRNTLGVRIQQLLSDMYYPVINMLQTSTVEEDPLCRLLQFKSEWHPIEELINRAVEWFPLCTSFVAIDEANDEVCGTLIGRIISSESVLHDIDKLKEMEAEEEKVRLAHLEHVMELKGKEHAKTNKNRKSGKLEDKDKEEENNNKKESKKATRGKSKHRKSSVTYGNNAKHMKNIEMLNLIPPEDIIPVEPKIRKPIYVFHDTDEGFNSRTLKMFMAFCNGIFESVNFFEDCDVMHYYKIYVWAVDTKYQNRGIGGDLLDAAEEMCIELEIPLMIVLCTSLKSQKIADKQGFMAVTKGVYKEIFKVESQKEKEAVMMIKFIEVVEVDDYVEYVSDKEEEGGGGAKKDEKPKGGRRGIGTEKGKSKK